MEEQRVTRLVDAVVRTSYEITKVMDEAGEDSIKKVETTIGGEVQGELSVPAYLSWVVGGKGSVKAAGNHKRGRDSAIKTAKKTELTLLDSSERKLEELALYYLLYRQDRIVFNEGKIEGSSGKPWYQAPSSALQVVPRPIAFLDLPPKIKLIPTAAEFGNGKIILLYQEL